MRTIQVGESGSPATPVGRCRELDNTDVLVARNVGLVEFTGHRYGTPANYRPGVDSTFTVDSRLTATATPTAREIAENSAGALKEFRRSVRTRKAMTFTCTHAVILGYLGAVHVRRGEIDEACSAWSTALDAMDGIHSARARQTIVDMRAALSAFRHSGVPATVELDARACAYLNTGSP